MDNRNEEELRASFLNQPLMPYIGAKLSTISPGQASIEIVYQKNITQQHGLFHGGVSGAIADNAAGFAAMTLMDKEKEPLTIEFKINFLNIADGEKASCGSENSTSRSKYFSWRVKSVYDKEKREDIDSHCPCNDKSNK